MGYMDFKKDIQRVIDSMIDDFARIRTGRASSELIENVKVNAYGTDMVLKSIATISVSDIKSLLVQPWDKSLVDGVVKGLMSSNLGLSAVAEGDAVRVSVPDLNEERRKEYVKVMKERSELARIGVRNVRHKAMKEIESLKEAGLSEDDTKKQKEEIEQEVKQANDKIAELRDIKEKELMTV
jgi:ribosome recycling factor